MHRRLHECEECTMKPSSIDEEVLALILTVALHTPYYQTYVADLLLIDTQPRKRAHSPLLHDHLGHN